MSASDRRRAVGVFGGTFNPVHIGHLRTAVELRQLLNLDEIRLIPCALPPHREDPEIQSPGVNSEHRMGMLRAAVKGEAGLAVDDRELRRAGFDGRLSYTVDTIRELRAELGPEVAICLCIGMDSLLNLSTWHRWEELLDFVHVVVAARPGWHAPDGCEVDLWVQRHQAESLNELNQLPCGRVWLAQMTLLPISSTEIRKSLVNGESVRYLLPDSVIDYINRNGLYR